MNPNNESEAPARPFDREQCQKIIDALFHLIGDRAWVLVIDVPNGTSIQSVRDCEIPEAIILAKSLIKMYETGKHNEPPSSN